MPDTRLDTFYRCMRGDTCIYCGLRATTKDHFQPRSHTTALFGVHNVRGLFTVPACCECNVLAGSKVFCSIGAKRRYIQAQLQVRYKRVLNIPNWTERELEEICPTLRTTIENGLRLRSIIRLRLAWRNASNVDKASSARDFGNASVRPNARPLGTGKKPRSHDKHGEEIDLTLPPTDWKKLTDAYVARWYLGGYRRP